ncbi:MerR family transcriptional regulator [Brevibacterium casei]|uniref:MerR family transcriptional regulator n=1 Tax=Brevibacterium casei TaxID=33889 RepID=UPI0036FCCCA0
MLLNELAAASGCSAATIKYYRREGLLPAGERITATRQDYGTRHLERLTLIQVLREVADAPIPAIRRLTALIDDPSVPLIRALEEGQAIALGDLAAGDPATGDRPEHPTVAALLERMGWPDIGSIPRRALDEALHTLAAWEMPDGIETIARYAVPMAEIARGDVDSLQSTDDADEPSEDVKVMRAVAGTIAFDRLIRALRALGHVSLSVTADRSRGSAQH